MKHNETYIAHEWVGQDGCQYRDKMVWVGTGYCSYMQKLLANGQWWNV